MLETMENTKAPNIGFLPSRRVKFGREGCGDRQARGDITLKYNVLKGCETRGRKGIDSGNGGLKYIFKKLKEDT